MRFGGELGAVARRAALAFALAALAAVPVQAQTLYRYIDETGKVYYSDKPLTHLTGRPVDEISRNGTVLKRTAGAPTAAERAAQEEEARRRAESERLQTIEQRRNLALLATYSSEKEIHDAHAFALRDPMAELREAETRLASVDKRRSAHKTELDALGARASQQQRDQLATLDVELKGLTELLFTKRRDVQLINDRFEEDRRRYAEFAKRRQAALQTATGSPHTPMPAPAPRR